VSIISGKNQVTIPVEVLREAGLEAGDDVHIVSAGPGRLELVRIDDLINEFAGTFGADVYPPRYLEQERRGWG